MLGKHCALILKILEYISNIIQHPLQKISTYISLFRNIVPFKSRYQKENTENLKQAKVSYFSCLLSLVVKV